MLDGEARPHSSIISLSFSKYSGCLNLFGILPADGVITYVHGAWELGSHEAEIHTGQSVHFSVHFSLNRYVSFQFSSRCSKVKGSPSDPERLGKWLNTAFYKNLV